MNCWHRLEKKRQICKYFFGISELLEHPFLSEHFPKFICGGVFSSIAVCRLYLYLEGTPQHKFFWIFFNFVLVKLFQNTLMKSSVTEFSSFGQ